MCKKDEIIGNRKKILLSCNFALYFGVSIEHTRLQYAMGEYRWKTFSEVNMLAINFGKGLRELGNRPGENIVIFAETRAEWMIAAQGIFKQNIPLVTIYATLGDEAIAHGINETEVSTVITSFDLLPKFKKILPLTPRVKTLVYMEDQLKSLDLNGLNGYKEGVQIIKFSEVLKKGAESTVGECFFFIFNSGSYRLF